MTLIRRIDHQKRILLILYLLIPFGCGPAWQCIPKITKADNQYFEVLLSSPDFYALNVIVKNKSDKNIEIAWNRSFFIDPTGGTNGLFTFGKEEFWEDKDFTYPITVISPNSSIERRLYPIANRHWRKGWGWDYSSPGINGILLTIIVDGKEITEKMSFEFKK